MNYRFLLCFLVLLMSSLLVKAKFQNDSTLVLIEMNDGNIFTGLIINEDSLKVYLKTNIYGQLGILRSEIKSLKAIDSNKVKNDKLWFDNVQATRYFWAPNGYGLKSGQGYYQNIYVFWNQFSLGLTDQLSLGGGVIPLFLFGGAPTPVFILPKFSVPVIADKVNIGAGALLGTILGEDNSSFGLLYGTTTFGTLDNNVSVGMAYGFAGGKWADRPVINLSGLFRLTDRGYFITENYYLYMDNIDITVIGLGGRWIIKKAAIDFMLGIPITEGIDSFVALPIIGFTIPF